MTNQEIETAFELWYDSRKGMPPASFESFKSGISVAMNFMKGKDNANINSKRNGAKRTPSKAGSR